LKLTESEFRDVFEMLPLTTLEGSQYPINYNLLTGQQEEFFKEVVMCSLNKYYDNYLELLNAFKQELVAISEQVQEVIDESKN